MKLTTEIPIKAQENKIDYSSRILLMGSCFSENIGSKLDYFKFRNLQNPFGIIVNPVSIEKLLVRAMEKEPFVEDDVFQHNGIWKCFEAHSVLGALDKNAFIKNLNDALHRLRSSLISATHIIFTFGTSWIYRHIESDNIVANCHKLPPKDFKKELLPIETISKSIAHSVKIIKAVNPDVAIITTISPVRHIKDGFVENSQSKAHLISAIHNFENLPMKINNQPTKISNRHSFYFPSYEIMMDELRDYRFYREDMLHPNKTAIDIIWEKFSTAWISTGTESLQNGIASIQRGLNHKPFNPKSQEHLRFLKKIQDKIAALQKRFPHITF